MPVRYGAPAGPWFALLVLVALLGGLAGLAGATPGATHPTMAPSGGTGAPGPRTGTSTPLTAVPVGRAAGPTELKAADGAVPRPSGARPAASSNIGQVLTTLTVGSDPLGVTADPTTGEVYVSNDGSNTVTILKGTSMVATVALPAEPDGGVFDPASGEILVSDYGANLVTPISGSTVETSVAVGSEPWPGAYDSEDSETYIPNEGSGNVSILKASGAPTSVALGSGTAPVSATYDPSDGYVYVSDYDTSEVSVLYQSTIEATIHVGAYPGGIVYDPSTGEVDVANSGSSNFTVIDGTGVVGNYQLPEPVWWAAYDSEDQEVYFTGFEGSDNITAVSGSTVVGNLEVGLNPLGADFEPTNGVLYVSSSNDGEVDVVSTGLFLGAASLQPNGVPSNTTDLGETFYIHADIYGNYSWSYAGWANVSDPGLGCRAEPINVSGFGGGLGTGLFNATCTPSQTGAYTVDVTVNATGRISVVTAIGISVNPRLVLGLPVASYGKRANLTSTDIGVHIGWNLTVSGGSGQYSKVSWVGFPIGTCSGEDTPSPTCSFTSQTSFSVSVSVTDTDGESGQSGTRTFTVLPLPTVQAPTSNRTDADVGQITGFNTTASQGSGGFTYHWTGVAAACATTSTPRLTCAPTVAGPWSVSVYVNDTNGGVSSTSNPVFLDVFSDPIVPAPVAVPAKVSTGTAFTISINVTGGPGDNTLVWYGLPTNGACYIIPPVTSIEHCTPSVAGTYEVYVACTDKDNYTIDSHTTQVVVSQGVTVGNGGGSGNNNGLFGLSGSEGYLLLGIGIVLIVAIVAFIAYRAGSRPSASWPEGEEEVGPDDGGAVPAEEGSEPAEEETPPGDEYYDDPEAPAPEEEAETEVAEGEEEAPLEEEGEEAEAPVDEDGEAPDDGPYEGDDDGTEGEEGTEEPPKSRWWRRSS